MEFPVMPDMERLQQQLRMRVPDIPRPYIAVQSGGLGVEAESLTGQLAEYFGVKDGVLVRSVLKDSVAEKAGLHPGLLRGPRRLHFAAPGEQTGETGGGDHAEAERGHLAGAGRLRGGDGAGCRGTALEQADLPPGAGRGHAADSGRSAPVALRAYAADVASFFHEHEDRRANVPAQQ